jgi:hypothetical protein
MSSFFKIYSWILFLKTDIRSARGQYSGFNDSPEKIASDRIRTHFLTYCFATFMIG